MDFSAAEARSAVATGVRVTDDSLSVELSDGRRIAVPLAWYPNDDPRLLNPELHRWHDAMWGAVAGILEGGTLLSLLWRPREKGLLVQFMALLIVVGTLTILPFEPSIWYVALVNAPDGFDANVSEAHVVARGRADLAIWFVTSQSALLKRQVD